MVPLTRTREGVLTLFCDYRLGVLRLASISNREQCVLKSHFDS